MMRLLAIGVVALVCAAVSSENVAAQQVQVIERPRGDTIEVWLTDEGRDDRAPMIMRARCADNLTTVVFGFGAPLPKAGQIQVAFADGIENGHFGFTQAGKAPKEMWVQRPSRLLRRMVESGRMAVRLPSEQFGAVSQFTAINEDGLRGIYDLAARCGWAQSLPAKARAREALGRPISGNF